VQPTYDVTQMLRELCDRPAVPHWTKLNFMQPDLATDYMASHTRVAVSFRYWLNKLGIQRSTHPGRRAFCSVIANHSGMSPTAAARLTGQSIQTFESYVTPDPDAARLAIRTAFQKAEELCTTKKNQIHLKPALQAPSKSPESSADAEPKAGQ
jgi:hypothetical protein